MIVRLYIAKCGRCGVYPAPDSSPRKTLEETALAAVADTEHDAVAHAVKKGWSAYPLLCPQCAEEYRSNLRGGPGEPQDRGAVPEPGQGPERAGRSG